MKKCHPCTSWFRAQPPLQPRGSCLQPPTYEASQPPAPLPSSTLKDCSSTQPQASPSLTSLCSPQKLRLRVTLPLHGLNLPWQPSLPGLEHPTSPRPYILHRPKTHYPRPLIYSAFCSHRWVSCDWKPEAPLQPCATLPLPSSGMAPELCPSPLLPVWQPQRRWIHTTGAREVGLITPPAAVSSSLSPSGRQLPAPALPRPVLLPLLLALRRSMAARERLSKAHADLRPPGSLCRHPRPCPDRQEKAASLPSGAAPALGRIRAGGASGARSLEGALPNSPHSQPDWARLAHAVPTPLKEGRGERQNAAPRQPPRLQGPKPRSSQPGPTISFRCCSL